MIKFFIVILLLLKPLFAEMIRDKTTETVYDDFNGLLWQDDRRAKALYLDWHEANIFCKKLNLHGIKDWRLSYLLELLTITDSATNGGIAIKKAFKNVQPDYYWTVETCQENKNLAGFVYFGNGDYSLQLKDHTELARCVKNK